MYPKYKDSCVDWLGEVPADWIVIKLGRAAFMQEGPGLRNWQFTDEGTRVICVTNITENGIDFTRLEKFISVDEFTSSYTHFTVQSGDILLSSSGNSWGKVAVYGGDEKVMLNTSTIRLNESANSKLSRDFLAMVLQSDTVREQLGLAMTGSCQPNFGPTHLSSVLVTVPPIAEQTLIAGFLKRETAKIDELVAEQRRLIELLKEKRQAVISHAVTKGLNPSVPLKPSGIEWLGDVPEHWGVGSLRYFASFCTGSTPDRNIPDFWGGTIPWVKTGEVKYSLITETEECISQAGLDSSSCTIAAEGTILMALYGQGVTRGRVAILGVPAAFNQACAAISVDGRLNNKFVHAFFVFAYAFIRDVGNETTQMNMNIEFVRRVRIVVPPIDEQQMIADHVEAESERFDRLTTEAERAIELLQERRTALISAAVTGKIDVRKSVGEVTTK